MITKRDIYLTSISIRLDKIAEKYNLENDILKKDEYKLFWYKLLDMIGRQMIYE